MPLGIDDLIFLGLVGAWIAWVNHEVQQASGGQYDNFVEAIVDGIDQAISDLMNSSDPMAPIFASLLGTLKGAAQVFGITLDNVAFSVNDISDLFMQTTTLALEHLTEGQVSLKGLLDEINTYLQDKIKTKLDEATRASQEIKAVVENGIKDVIDTVGDQASKVANTLLDEIAKAMHITESGFAFLNDYIDAAFDGISRGIQQGIGNVTDKINEMIESSLHSGEMIANAQMMSSLVLLDGLSKKIDEIITPTDETIDNMIDTTLKISEKMLRKQLDRYREFVKEFLPTLRHGG